MNRIKQYGKNTFASLSIRNYRLYFIGQAISLSGTWMQVVAQGLLVLKLTNSGTILGIIAALQFLPVLLFGPYGGVIADRFPKRNILFVTQSTASILALLLAVLVGFHLVQIWMVGVLACCLGLVNMVDNPTRSTFLHEMVGKELLPNAVTLNAWEVNLARVIGPVIAGAIVATFGLVFCFLFNSISFIAVLVVLYYMDISRLQPVPVSPRKKGQLREGFSYVASSPTLRNVLIMLAIVGTLTYEFVVSLPLLAQFTFHNLTGGYSALMTAMGIGAVIGGLFTAGRKKTHPTMLIGASLFFAVAMFTVAIAPTLFFASLAMVLVGAASINFNSIGIVTLQFESLPQMRGRVMSLWTVAFLGSTPIGGPIIGWIGEHLGPRYGVSIGGLAALIAACIGFATLKQSKIHRISTPVNVANLQEQARTTAKIPE